MEKSFKSYYYILIPVLFALIYPTNYLLGQIPGNFKTPLRLLALLIVFLFYVHLLLQEQRISKFLLGYGVFWLYIVAITMWKQNSMAVALYGMGILPFGMMMLFEVFAKEQKQKIYLILYSTIYVMILLNLVTYNLYSRNYMDSKYFFGNTNAWFNYYFPGLVFGYLYYINNKKNWILNASYAVLIGIVLTTSLQNRSMTTFVVLTFLIAYSFFLNRQTFYRFFNTITYIIINVLVFLLVVYPGSKGNGVAAFVAGVLKKDVSFSGRTPLWDTAREVIGQQLWTGYGAYRSEDLIKVLNAGDLCHFHNMYYTEAYIGGLIGLALFLGLFFIVGLRVWRMPQGRARGYLMTILFVICMRGQMESNLHLTIILSLCMAYYLENGYLEAYNYISLRPVFAWLQKRWKCRVVDETK